VRDEKTVSVVVAVALRRFRRRLAAPFQARDRFPFPPKSTRSALGKAERSERGENGTGNTLSMLSRKWNIPAGKYRSTQEATEG